MITKVDERMIASPVNTNHFTDQGTSQPERDSTVNSSAFGNKLLPSQSRGGTQQRLIHSASTFYKRPPPHMNHNRELRSQCGDAMTASAGESTRSNASQACTDHRTDLSQDSHRQRYPVVSAITDTHMRCTGAAPRTFRCRSHILHMPNGSVIRIEGYYLYLAIQHGSSRLEPTARHFTQREATCISSEIEEQWLQGLATVQELLASDGSNCRELRLLINDFLQSPALIEIWHVFQRLSESPHVMPERLELCLDPKLTRYNILTARTKRVDARYLKKLLDIILNAVITIHQACRDLHPKTQPLLGPKILSMISLILRIIQYNKDGLCHVRSPCGVALMLPFHRFLAKISETTRPHMSDAVTSDDLADYSPDATESVTSTTLIESAKHDEVYSHRQPVRNTKQPRGRGTGQKFDLIDFFSHRKPIPHSNDTHQFNSVASTALQYQQAGGEPSYASDSGSIATFRDDLSICSRPDTSRHHKRVAIYSQNALPVVSNDSSTCASSTLEGNQGHTKRSYPSASKNSKSKRQMKQHQTVHATPRLPESFDDARYVSLIGSLDPGRGYLAPRLFYAIEKSLMRTAYSTHKGSGFYPPQWKQLHIFPEQQHKWEVFRMKCMVTVIEVANRFELNEATLHDAWKLTNIVFYESLRRVRSLDDVYIRKSRGIKVTQRQRILFGVYVALIMAIKLNDRDGVIYELTSCRRGRRDEIRGFFLSPHSIFGVNALPGEDDSGASRSHSLFECDGKPSQDKRLQNSDVKLAFEVFTEEWESCLLYSMTSATPLENLERQIEICDLPHPNLIYRRACYVLARCYLTPSMDLDISHAEVSTASMYAAMFMLIGEGSVVSDNYGDSSLKAAKLVKWPTNNFLQCCEDCFVYFSKHLIGLDASVAHVLSVRYSTTQHEFSAT